MGQIGQCGVCHSATLPILDTWYTLQDVVCHNDTGGMPILVNAQCERVCHIDQHWLNCPYWPGLTNIGIQRGVAAHSGHTYQIPNVGTTLYFWAPMLARHPMLEVW